MFVKSFWQLEGSPLYRKETILPKGVIEFIFSFDDAVAYSRNKETSNNLTPRCFVNGMNDTPLELTCPMRQSFFGLTMQAFAVKKLLKIPSGFFLNQVIDLESINKEFTVLWHQMAEAETFNGRTAIMQEWIGNKLTDAHQQEIAIADFLNGPGESISVKGLASRFCYSSRQLQRKSKEIFGMNTEDLIGYKRYLNALRYMHHSDETLTRIAYECHYYDQAHFNREFKTYTGLTPREYRQSKSMLAGHLYQ